MQAATTLFNRLTEVEKSILRSGTAGQIEHLSDTVYRSSLPGTTFDQRVVTVAEAQALCLLEFSTKSARESFIGVTWKF
jgi:predicted NAD/FAD-binding protein